MESKMNQAYDYDTEKATLVRKSSLLEESLGQDFESLKEYIDEYGKKALIIGGSLLAAYLIARLISGTSSHDEEIKYTSSAQPVVHVVKESEDSPIVKQIKASIALFLISIAKQKLREFIATYNTSEKV
jgi:hypothetical protein